MSFPAVHHHSATTASMPPDIAQKISRSEARAERSKRRGSLGVELPEHDVRRQIGCRLMNLGNSCYQNCILQILVNLPDVRERLVAFAGGHQDCEEEYCFPRDLAQHAIDVPIAAAKGQALSATWVLKYQQAGEGVMGDLYRQSDPACFLHAAADWCVDRATSPSHALPLFSDLWEGQAFEHEWVSPSSFPACPARPKNLHAQPFLMLNIPVPSSPSSLETCLKESVFEDKVVGGRECEEERCPYGRPATAPQGGGGGVAATAGAAGGGKEEGRTLTHAVSSGSSTGGRSTPTRSNRSSPLPPSLPPAPPASPRHKKEPALPPSAPTPPARHEKHQHLRLARLPRYLCLRLLRFDNSLKKIRTAVTFEETLEFGPFFSGGGGEGEGLKEEGAGNGDGGGGRRKRTRSMASMEGGAMAAAAAAAAAGGGGEGGKVGGREGGQGSSSEYELMSVVLHQGRTRQRGHYYLYHRVLEGVQGGENYEGGGGEGGSGGGGKWWLFDDAKRHEEVDSSRVLRATDEVYMLVYRRKEGEREGGMSQQQLHGASASAAAAAAAASSFPSSSSSSSTSSSSSSSAASAGTSTSAATSDSAAGSATAAAAAATQEEEEGEEEGKGGFASSPPTSPGGSLRKRGRPPLTVVTDPKALEGGGGGMEGGRERGEGVKAKVATTPGRKRAASR